MWRRHLDSEWRNDIVNVLPLGIDRLRALYAFQTNTVSFDLNGQPAAVRRIPSPSASFHHWNLAEIGTIRFPEGSLQLLTFRYGKGNNFAYFEFELAEFDPGFNEAAQTEKASATQVFVLGFSRILWAA